ncbi:MAG: transglycosylase domain-containing protein [Alphaproteobacteria bacterium]
MIFNGKAKLLIVISLIILIGSLIFYYCYDLPSLEKLERKQSQLIIHIDYNDSSRLLNESEISSGEIDFFQIPNQLINAVILTEDRKFFSHQGLDYLAIIRAYIVNKKAGKIVQGGSTITQQLAKMLFLQPQKTFKRKIQEAILALQLEQYFTKEQILTFYLNHAYFGSGNYGIKQASKEYFNKKVSDLTLEESALLAGLLKAPSKISPKNDHNLARQRANIVLEIIKKNNHIQGFKNNQSSDFIGKARFYFSDYVLKNYQKFLDSKNIFNQELTITSTLDKKTQDNIEQITQSLFNENKKELESRQIAVVVSDYSGAIIAMIGGNNYGKNSFNHAIDQTKSIDAMFDNFIYLSALDNEIKINEVFSVGLNDYSNQKTAITLQSAFANELSSKSANGLSPISNQLLNKLSLKKIYETMQWCGFDKKNNLTDQSLVNQELASLVDLVSAFATVANDGFKISPYFISQISDSNKNILYQKNHDPTTRFFKKNTASKMKELLRYKVQRGNLKNINISDNIFASISNNADFSNNWLIGFDNSKIIGIWLGNNKKNKSLKPIETKIITDLFANIARIVR